MPTFSISPALAGLTATSPSRDRLGAFLAASWAALHLPVLALLGFAAQHQIDAQPEATALPATAPDRLIEGGHR
ncbi:hypothetical protein BOQ63_002215 (plasmid) [Streptomyces viridifaciens]|nr:hypothetical protein BOQ63_002215 [Streptomyces viridifaciens]